MALEWLNKRRRNAGRDSLPEGGGEGEGGVRKARQETKTNRESRVLADNRI